jgi:hypothetical protein
LDAQGAQSELTLANAMLEFDAGDRDSGIVEDLEAEHRSGPRLHASRHDRPALRANRFQRFSNSGT